MLSFQFEGRCRAKRYCHYWTFPLVYFIYVIISVYSSSLLDGILLYILSSSKLNCSLFHNSIIYTNDLRFQLLHVRMCVEGVENVTNIIPVSITIKSMNVEKQNLLYVNFVAGRFGTSKPWNITFSSIDANRSSSYVPPRNY